MEYHETTKWPPSHVTMKWPPETTLTDEMMINERRERWILSRSDWSQFELQPKCIANVQNTCQRVNEWPTIYSAWTEGNWLQSVFSGKPLVLPLKAFGWKPGTTTVSVTFIPAIIMPMSEAVVVVILLILYNYLNTICSSNSRPSSLMVLDVGLHVGSAI